MTPRAAREAAWLAGLLAAGLVLPPLAAAAAQLAMGADPAEAGGAGALLAAHYLQFYDTLLWPAHLLERRIAPDALWFVPVGPGRYLGVPQPAAWLVVLAPYVLAQAVRLARSALRSPAVRG